MINKKIIISLALLGGSLVGDARAKEIIQNFIHLKGLT
jgi:hypothetical protein